MTAEEQYRSAVLLLLSALVARQIAQSGDDIRRANALGRQALDVATQVSDIGLEQYSSPR
jgi:hypothetical protein